MGVRVWVGRFCVCIFSVVWNEYKNMFVVS